MNIKTITNATLNRNNYIMFRSLDFDKDWEKRKLSNVKTEISSLESQITSEKNNFRSKESSLDNQIGKLEQDVSKSDSKISGIKSRINSKNLEIVSARSKGESLSKEISKNNAKIKNLQSEQSRITNETIKHNKMVDEKASEKLMNKSRELEQEYIGEVNEATEGLKSLLIQKVINPTISAMESEENEIPSSIYIANSANAKPNETTNLFEWIVRMTDSNFAKIQANDFSNNESRFFTLLKKTAINSELEYEKNRSHSFTLIDNFDLLMSIKDSKLLNEILKNFKDFHHNTIIAISKVPYEKIASLFKFENKFEINKTFLSNERFGIKSIIKQLQKLESSGKNLLK